MNAADQKTIFQLQIRADMAVENILFKSLFFETWKCRFLSQLGSKMGPQNSAQIVRKRSWRLLKTRIHVETLP